ncbi:MAG TPA: glycosyl transferase, partial [Erysipelotrichaceae bacterium]|nr:glycosyl transferase [Erysipelotrichaceae bacterium]
MNKITIIVPIYNVEKYLRTCFDSLLNQTFDKYEILAVSDGSK